LFFENLIFPTKGYFENTHEGQMVSRFSNEIGRGPLNHLGAEQRANYIAAMFC
jgi:hypothetical protein